MATSVGDLQAIIRLKDEMSPVLKSVDENVKRSQSVFSNFATGIAQGFGQQAFAALVRGAQEAVAVISELGTRGADVADVAGQFQLLQQAAGNTGDVLAGVRTAFAGTVNDFELMRSTNHAFSQGLKVTSTDLETTARSARVLADRIGGDAKQAYDTLLSAMATGRDRTLATIGLNIDAEAAVKRHADMLGVQAGRLSENEQIIAKRNAILQAMNDVLRVSGDAEVDFADRLEQGKVAWQNYKDAVGVAIAQSPAINAMLAGIAEAFDDALGDNQKQTTDDLIQVVNQAAIGVVQFGQVVVTAASVAAQGWNSLVAAFNLGATLMFRPIVLLVEGIARYKEAMASIPGVGVVWQTQAAGARKMADELSTLQRGFAAQAVQADKAAMDTARSFGTASVFLSKLEDDMRTAGPVSASLATALKKTGTDSKGMGENLGAAAKEADELAKKLQTAMGPSVESLSQDMDDLAKAMKAAKRDVSDLSRTELDNLILKLTELKAAGGQGAEGIELLAAATAEDLARALPVMRQFTQLVDDLDVPGPGATGITGRNKKGGGVASGAEAGKSFHDKLKELGTWEGGAKAFSSALDIAGDIASALEFAGVGEELAEGLNSAIEGGRLGSSIGSIFGPKGEVIGGLLGALGGGLKSFFGGPEILAVRDGVDLFERWAEGADNLAMNVDNVGSAFAAMAEDAAAAGRIGDRDMVRQIQLAREAGQVIPEMAEHVRASLDKAAEGLSAMLGTVNDDGELMGGMLLGVTPEDLQSQGEIFGAVFWGKVKEDGPVKAAEAMKPAWDAIQASATAAVAAGGAAFDISETLAPMAQIMALVGNEATSSIVAGIQGMDDALVGLADSGYLTRDAFTAFGQQAQSAHDALVANGVDGNTALLAIAPTLAHLKGLSEQYGLTLDDATANLIEQAEAAGIAFETDPMSAMVTALEDVVSALQSIAGEAGNVAGAINDIPSHKTVSVVIETVEKTLKANGGGGQDGDPTTYAADGFEGWVNGPRRFVAGEAGPEYVSITPKGEMGGGRSGGRGPIPATGPAETPINLQVFIGGRKLDDVIISRSENGYI